MYERDEDVPRYTNSGRPYPAAHGPERYWLDVPPEQRSTGENVAAYYARVGWNSPASLLERCSREDEIIQRRTARDDRCMAAVRWYSSDLWRPCPWQARPNTDVCWKHGGWKELRMGRTRTVDLDEDCDGPDATVELKLGQLRLDTMARQLGRIKRAAESMGAPADAAIKIDTYGTGSSASTRVSVRWKP